MESIGNFEAIQDKDVDLHDLLEERFMFNECVPTLRQIACHEVALKLWHHYIAYDKPKTVQKKTNNHLRMAYGLDENYRDNSDKLVKFLNAPRCVEEMLKKSLDKIRTEMETWIRYFKEEMFKGTVMAKYCLHDFNPNYCVWFQNSEIDYKETASKILSNAELTHVQKFVILCLHGMADEIEIFPFHKLPRRFNELGYINFEISYWIPRCKSEVVDVMVKLVAIMTNEVDPKFNVIMSSYCANSSHRIAFEYFWNQLDEEEEISVALKVLPRMPHLQKTIVSKMSLYQQREVMSKIPYHFMANFFILEMPENAFKVWLHVKDQITEEEFASLFELVYECPYYSEICIDVLNDIWDTAPYRLRNHVAQTEVDLIFRSFIFNRQRTPSSWKLFLSFLSLTSPGTRKQLILDDGDLLTNKFNDNPNYMIDILELLLPNESERIQYKNRVMESTTMKENFVKLIEALEFDMLNQKLAFYSSNDHLTREIIKKLLNSNEIDAKIFILDYDKWNKLSNFILGIFANDLSTASELKKHLISSFSSDAIYYWHKSDNFSEMIKVAEQEFSIEELEAYKQTLLKKIQKGIVTSTQFWRYFDGNCFDTFVLWCLGDEKKVLEFKKLVSVDEIFDDVFGNICGWCEINGGEFEPYYLLNKLDVFLRYFCPDHEEVRKFKMRKLNELNQHMFPEAWLHSDDRAWYKVLMWGFENDQDEILKFQSNGPKDMKKRRKLDLQGCFHKC